MENNIRTTSRLAILAIGLAVLAAGCAQSQAESPVGAGKFFQEVGPVSLVFHSRAETSPRPDFAEADPVPASETALMPDSKIRLDLGMRLTEANLPVSNLVLKVDDQRVMLEGRAETHRARDRVELLARSHEAVRGVDNRLRVDRRPETEAALVGGSPEQGE